MKYRPDYPDRFGSIEDARCWARGFFPWYNQEHHHTALGLMPPAVVHYGQAEAVREARGQVLLLAYQTHPERFVRGLPQVAQVPDAVWINKPEGCPEGCPEGWEDEVRGIAGEVSVLRDEIHKRVVSKLLTHTDILLPFYPLPHTRKVCHEEDRPDALPAARCSKRQRSAVRLPNRS